MAGADEPADASLVQSHNGAQRRLDADVVTEYREVADIFFLGPVQRHRRRRSGGFETHRKEHDFAIGVFPSNLQGIQGRIHETHVATPGFGLLQRTLSSGDPHHVAKSSENHAGTIRQPQRIVDSPQRNHANRATRSVNELDALR